jgi:hypothetical protein
MPPTTVTQSTSVVLIDTATSNSPYIVLCPNLSTVGRLITVRDNAGFASYTNQIIVSTTSGVQFQDNTSSITINQPYAFVTLQTIAGGNYALVNTFGFPPGQSAAYVSNVTASTIQTNQLYFVDSNNGSNYLMYSSSGTLLYNFSSLIGVDGTQLNSTVTGLGTAGYLSSIPTATGTGTWVATGITSNFGTNDPTGTIVYSLDSRTWLNASGGFTRYGVGAVFGNGVWVAIGDNSDGINPSVNNGYIQRSIDGGATWSYTNYTGSLTTAPRGIGYGNGLFIATFQHEGPVGSALRYSGDGINWSNSVNNAFQGGVASRVAYGGGIWVAVGWSPLGSINGTAVWSPDGSNWTNATSVCWTSTNVWGVGFDGSRFVITPTGGVGNPNGSNVAYSGDGKNWTNAGVTGGNFADGALDVYGYDRQWVLTTYFSPNANRFVNTSVDGGLTWTSNVSPFSNFATSAIPTIPFYDGDNWWVGFGNGTSAQAIYTTSNLSRPWTNTGFTGGFCNGGTPIAFAFQPSPNNALYALFSTTIGYRANFTTTNLTSLTLLTSTITTSNLNLFASATRYGSNAGQTGQGANAVAIGNTAGKTSQGASAIAIGIEAGFNTQSAEAVAIGRLAGTTTQGADAVAIGNFAGRVNQGANATAVGVTSGDTNQGADAIAIGNCAGCANQSPHGIALGYVAGFTSQGQGSIAIGSNSATTSQGTNSVSIGVFAGSNTQGAASVSLGFSAGSNLQGATAISIGSNAGSSSQGVRSIAIGSNAATTSQGTDSVAIGAAAGTTSQGGFAVAIGPGAGQTSQQSATVAIGSAAGQTSQSVNSVAIGPLAGQTNQQTNAVALGVNAGNTSQQANAIAIGREAGYLTQQSGAVAIGVGAAYNTQSANAIAIGNGAANQLQGSGAIAIGGSSGISGQGTQAVAVGSNAGGLSQGAGSVAVGALAGLTSQQANSIAIGFYAGQTSQQGDSIAIGIAAGSNQQQAQAVAVGGYSGQLNQQLYATAIGWASGQSNQQSLATALGYSAGISTQQTQATAVGAFAGQLIQQTNATALGYFAGRSNQGAGSVALGTVSGQNAQGANSVAVGFGAGSNTQGTQSIAIGALAGQSNQGANAIAIGYLAGQSPQSTNTIILNASGSALNTDGSSRTYVNPVRLTSTFTSSVGNLLYNTQSSELVVAPPYFTQLGTLTSTWVSSGLGNTYPMSIPILNTGPTGTRAVRYPAGGTVPLGAFITIMPFTAISTNVTALFSNLRNEVSTFSAGNVTSYTAFSVFP